MSGAPQLPKTFRVSLLDVATLLYHVHRGAQHSEVGYEDAEHTLEKLTRDLFNRRVLVPRAIFESSLWSCNLMSEQREFWSPHGESFNEFVKRLIKINLPLQPAYFDKTYNLIRFRDE